jgi:hypothetical protein
LTPLLSSAYLPSISCFAQCVRSEKIILEQHEHYVKQTYRNRANIFGANGLLPLVIPVQHENLFSIPINEVKISYDSQWQKIHWRSITSAYRNSAYFEFFEDEFSPFYKKKYETLFELNFELTKKIFFLLGLKTEISYSETFEKEIGEGIIDLRNQFHRRERKKFPEYYQPFSVNNGFIPDLSIVDLLFNEGKNSLEYLKSLPD